MYLQSSASDKDKVSRLKMEVQYARDTSLSLKRQNPVWNPVGENIKILLSKN